MKKNILYILLFLVTILFTNCSSQQPQSNNQNQQDIVEQVQTQTQEESINQDTNKNVRVIDLEGFNYGYNLKEIRLKKGETVRIQFRSTEGFHDVVIDELDVASEKVREGEITGVTFTPEIVGTFEFYCSVGKHRENGMFGTIIIE